MVERYHFVLTLVHFVAAVVVVGAQDLHYNDGLKYGHYVAGSNNADHSIGPEASGRHRQHQQSERAYAAAKEPQFVTTHFGNHSVRVGKDVTLACSAKHLRHPDNHSNGRLAWLHSDRGTLAVHPEVIAADRSRIRTSDDGFDTYYLTISDVTPADSGRYICQINTDPVMSISGYIYVEVPPDIVDAESSADTVASEGVQVVLNCQAKASPPATVSWMRIDGQPIRMCHRTLGQRDPNKASQSVLKNSELSTADGVVGSQKHCKEVEVHYGEELELAEVSRLDAGTYLCLASNGVPPTVSKQVRLYVDFKPTVHIPNQRVGSVTLDSLRTAKTGTSEIRKDAINPNWTSATMECITAAHPPSLNFWSHTTNDGGDLSEDREPNKYEVSEVRGEPSFYNVMMRLTIYNVRRQDLGRWRCLAKNAQGVTSGRITLYERHPSAEMLDKLMERKLDSSRLANHMSTDNKSMKASVDDQHKSERSSVRMRSPRQPFVADRDDEEKSKSRLHFHLASSGAELHKDRLLVGAPMLAALSVVRQILSAC